MLDWGFSLLAQRIMVQLVQAILRALQKTRKEKLLMKHSIWYSYVFHALRYFHYYRPELFARTLKPLLFLLKKNIFDQEKGGWGSAARVLSSVLPHPKISFFVLPSVRNFNPSKWSACQPAQTVRQTNIIPNWSSPCLFHKIKCSNHTYAPGIWYWQVTT